MTESRLDGELIALLKQNARLPTAELARRLGVARSTIQARLERLEQTGAILGYTIRPGQSKDHKALVSAHVAIRVSPRHQLSVERHLAKLPGLVTLHAVSGSHDMIAIIHAPNTAELDRQIDAIREADGVVETNSAIILTTRISR